MSVFKMPALLKPFELELGQEKIDESVIRFLLDHRGIKFHDNTNCLFYSFANRQAGPCKVRLHSRTIRSFGFDKATRLQAAYNRAQKEGYSLCVPEVLFRLLLMREQVLRAGTACLFAMEPLEYRDRGCRLVVPKLSCSLRTQGVRYTVEMVTGDPFMIYPLSTELMFTEVLR